MRIKITQIMPCDDVWVEMKDTTNNNQIFYSKALALALFEWVHSKIDINQGIYYLTTHDLAAIDIDDIQTIVFSKSDPNLK